MRRIAEDEFEDEFEDTEMVGYTMMVKDVERSISRLERHLKEDEERFKAEPNEKAARVLSLQIKQMESKLKMYREMLS